MPNRLSEEHQLHGFTVTFTYTPGTKGRFGNTIEDSEPPSGAEIEISAVHTPKGEDIYDFLQEINALERIEALIFESEAP